MSQKASSEEKQVLEQYLLPFLNLEKKYPLLPGINDSAAMAAILGIEEEELLSLREEFNQNAKQAALELLNDDEVQDWLDKLPFEKDDTIIALGDSITDDLQGWFTILQHVLEITVPEANFTFKNAGLSYDTSSDALQRLNRDVLAEEPDWVIVALGTFDAQRLHVAPDRTLVPLAEYWENLNTIEQAVEKITDNPIIWITPPAVITDMMQKMRFFDYSIFEDDLKQYREIITGKKGYIVDPLGTRMGEDNPEAWYFLSDGLHPSMSGHLNTVKELLRSLATSKVQEGASFEPPEDYVGDQNEDEEDQE